MSMNVAKIFKTVEIEEEKFVMVFDMESVKTYKLLTGKSYLQSAAQLSALDDEIIIGFLGSVLRPVEKPNVPIGKGVYDLNLLYLLTELAYDVIDMITAAMPQGKGGQSKKK